MKSLTSFNYLTLSILFLLFFSGNLVYSQCPDLSTCTMDQIVPVDIDSDVSLCAIGGTSIGGDFTSGQCTDTGGLGLACTAYVFTRSPQSIVTSIGGEIGQGNGCNGEMDDVYLQYTDPTTGDIICEDLLPTGGSQLNLGLLFPADIDEEGNWLVTEIIVFMCANSNAFPTLCGACANDPSDCTGCDTGDEITRPCDDGDICTENDMVTIDNCGLECVPCAGTPIDGCGEVCMVDAPVITVTENTCDPMADGFYEVTTACASGFGIEFSTDAGATWGTVLPTYPTPFITRCVEEMCLIADLTGLDATMDAVNEVNMGTIMIGSAVLSIDQTFNGSSTLDENEITTSQTTGDLGISSGVAHTCIEDACGQIANSMNNLYNFSEPVCNFTIDLWDLDRDDEMILTASGPNGPVTYTINTIGAGVDNTGNIFSSNDPTVNYPGDGPATLGMFSVTFDDCITQISIDYYDSSNTSGNGGSYTIVFQEGCMNQECMSDEVAVAGNPIVCQTCEPTDPVIIVNDNVCPATTGSYTIQTPCGAGFNLEYSTDNGVTWVATQPIYPEEFLARCIDANDDTCISNQIAISTNLEICCTPIDPVIAVTENMCDPEIDGFYTVQTGCGTGFNLEYSIDNGATWITTQPVYPTEFLARCIDAANPTCISNEIAISTSPMACCVDDPIAMLAMAGPACTGTTVTFDASASLGAITSYEWDFDGDGTIDATTTVPSATFTYPTPGTYTASVTVIDGSGLCPSSTTSIEVVICGINAVVCPPSPITIVDGDPIDPTTLGEPQVTTNACNPTFEITNVDTTVPGTCPLEEIITRTFTITDACGQSECVQIINVEIDNPAVINALPITPEICLGDVVTLDASASVGDGLTYCWNVGIGTVGCDYTTATAIHQYTSSGTYDVSLMITDVFGCTDEQVVGTVIVYDPPVAALAPAGPACAGTTVSFDASASSGQISPYEWDFDGDGTIDATTTVPTATFTYPTPGTYTAFVTVIDERGLCPSSTISTEVIICGTNAFVCPPAEVTIVDGDPMDTGTLGMPQVTTNECNPTFDITSVDESMPGMCPFEEIITRTFTITDNCGQNECVQIINVEVDNPASINSLPITPEICLGDIVTLDASASIGDGLTYCWNVGIGTVGCDYTTATASHQYAASGTYEITLMITDQFGCTDEQVVGSVIVYEGPEAIATAVFDPCTLELVYDASGSIDNAAPSDLIYTWDFGDGSTSGTASGTYVFDNCGSVGTVTLSILDPSVPFPACNSDQLTFTFDTDSEPPVLVCPAPSEINCGDPIPLYADLSEFLAAGGTATDNCAVLALNQVSLDTIPGLCPYVHTIEIVYEALDVCNNRATCTQIVNLLPSLPSASIPDDVILSCGDDFSTDATGLPVLNQTDCTRPSTLSVDDEIISGSCPGDVTIERTFTVLDDCGNEQVYVQIISIVNDISPTLEGPPDITIGCLDACDPDATGGIATVVDFCMPIDGSTNTVTVTYTDLYVGFDGSAGLGGIVGYIIRTFTAVDACGNEGIYVQTISVMRDATTALTCNDQVNVSLAPDCQGITPDFLLEAPEDTKYFITLEDGQFGYSLDPNETFDSIDWSIYIESGEPFTYTITDFCGNSCWGQVLIESNIIPEFETPCTYEQGYDLDNAGEINDLDELELNDMISINEDPGRTTDYLGTIRLTDGSCQEAFVVGFSNFRYNAARHGAPLDIQYVDLELYLVNTEDGSVLSFVLPTGTIGVTALPELQLNPGHYDVFVSAADYRAFGDYSIHIEVTGCVPTCTTICAGDYPDEFVTVEEINETLAEGCYATMLGDILVERSQSGDMCDGILHVVSYTGLFELHGELVKHELITQAYIEQPIDLSQYDIQAPGQVDLDCGADVSPEGILAETEDGTQAYPYYLDFDDIKEDTICLEELVVHYDVPVDTVQEMVSLNGIWVLVDIVKKERRDSIQCLRRGPNPEVQYQEILLDENLCNVLVEYTDMVIEACAGGQKVVRDWTIIDWCDNNAQINLSQTIEVRDRQAPDIEKLDDIVISIDPWSCAGIYKLPVRTHMDNCNSDLLTESWQLSEGQVADGYALDLWLGNSPIEAYLSVIDDCGNTALDTFNIFVEDHIAPVPVCETNINVTLTSAMLALNEGGGKVYAESFDAGSHDSGCSTEITIQARRMTGCCATDCIAEYECIETDSKTGMCIDSTIVGYTSAYADFVKFCCEDVGEIVMVEILVTDQVGNTNTCMVEVIVVDKTQSILTCPPVTVNCEDDMNALSDPLITGQYCDAEGEQAILFNESDINGYCGTEQLIREWYIDRNADGEFSSGDPYCRQVVSITNEDGGMDPYTIKWPKHYTGEVVQGENVECESDGTIGIIAEASIEMGEVQVCGVNREAYGEPIWCEAACSLIAHSMEVDTIFSSDACFKLINRWTIIDWCKWDSNGGEVDDDNDSTRDQFIAVEDWAQGDCAACPEEGPVFDDPVYFKYETVEEDGYYTFDQIIKVIDDSSPTITVVSTHEVSTTGGAISKDDATSCRGDEDLTATVADFCNGVESPAELVRWNVTVQRGEYIIDIQNGVGSSMTINSGTGSPGDKHIITWIAIDGCGNATEATTEVTFGDDVPPTPFCIAAVSTSFPAGQDSVVVWASDVDFGSYDNCTDHSDLQWAIVPEGQFPLEPGDEGFDDQFGFSIACEDEPVAVFIHMWIWDESGNSDFCRTSILIDSGCQELGSSAYRIAGRLQTELGMVITDATVVLNSAIPEYPRSQTVTNRGEYSFENNPSGYNYVISPEKDMNHANGVTTLDLLLIQRHILGLRDLGSPYKLIAADVTNDRIISGHDIVEARRLVLGITERFRNNQSWRFVDGAQDFISTDNPWPFTEVRDPLSIDDDLESEDFIGTKIGDVNDNATPSEGMLVESRYESTLQLEAKLSQTRGNVVEVMTEGKVDLYGLQFTLSDINNAVVSIQSPSLDIREENYHIDGQTNFSWHVKDGHALNDRVVFEIEFADKLTEAQLDRLSIESGVTKAEAYMHSTFEVWDIALNIESVDLEKPSLSQNWPNPFSKSTLIEFELPASTDQLSLSIYNASGQLVLTQSGSYTAGAHQIEIHARDLGASGIYHYTLKTEAFTQTKQMMVMD